MVAKQEEFCWIEYAKGTAILLVVLGHCWRGLHSAGMVPEPLFAALDARIYAFHMPVFFALSGLFVISSLRRNTAGHFLRNRAVRLLWPIVFWTYAFLGLRSLAGDLANDPNGAGALLVFPFPGMLHLWYLWALFCILSAAVLLRPLLTASMPRGPLLLGLFAGSVLLSAVPLPPGSGAWIGPAIAYCPFVVLGMGLAHWLDRKPNLSGLAPFAMLGFAGLLLAWPLLPAGLQPVGTALLTVLFLVSFAALPSLRQTGQTGQTGPWSVLALMGRMSMAIYLVHTVFSAALRGGLLSAGLDGLWLHLVLGTLIGCAGPILLYHVAQRCGATALLGFEPARMPQALRLPPVLMNLRRLLPGRAVPQTRRI